VWAQIQSEEDRVTLRRSLDTRLMQTMKRNRLRCERSLRSATLSTGNPTGSTRSASQASGCGTTDQQPPPAYRRRPTWFGRISWAHPWPPACSVGSYFSSAPE
jgi:hypothetical protein